MSAEERNKDIVQIIAAAATLRGVQPAVADDIARNAAQVMVLRPWWKEQQLAPRFDTAHPDANKPIHFFLQDSVAVQICPDCGARMMESEHGGGSCYCDCGRRV